MVSVAEILDAICDDKSLKLFNAIATKGGNSGDLSVQLKLSRKEYYSRMSRLMKTGMVKRKNGKHFLTAFGKGAVMFSFIDDLQILMTMWMIG